MNPPPNNQQVRTARMVLFLFVIAMLAHLCSYQLAHGAEERFVGSRAARGVSLELRNESTVVGEEIRLRQIARWSDADKGVLDPIGDLVVARVEAGKGFHGISLAEVKGVLRDAGVNIASVNIVGAGQCTVTRSDAKLADGAMALDQLTHAKATKPDATEDSGVRQPEKAPTPLAAAVSDSPYRTLRQLLETEYAERLGINAQDLQITFRPQDEKTLRLSEPHFKFEINPQRASKLGDVSWYVNLHGDTGVTRVFVQANAKAWQQQIVVVKPLATRQVITNEDVAARRTLTDSLASAPLLTREQIVGQMAARDLRAGTVLTAKLVEAMQMVRTGQFVTVHSSLGGIGVKTVARAVDSGSYGQTVRVKNETTKDVYRVIVTGPQQASVNAPVAPTPAPEAVAFTE